MTPIKQRAVLARRMRKFIDDARAGRVEGFRPEQSGAFVRSSHPAHPEEAYLDIFLDYMLDAKRKRHKFTDKLKFRLKGTTCLLAKAAASSGDLDDTIFRTITKQPMWLYDPCVQRRIWEAQCYEDSEFFVKLGEALGNQFPRRSAKERRTQSGMNFLRQFLVTLDRMGFADLSSRKRVEFDKVFKVIKDLKGAPKRLDSLGMRYLLGPKAFHDNCQKWFNKPQDFRP